MGLMLGSVLTGYCADRWGRRPTTLVCSVDWLGTVLLEQKVIFSLLHVAGDDPADQHLLCWRRPLSGLLVILTF